MQPSVISRFSSPGASSARFVCGWLVLGLLCALGVPGRIYSQQSISASGSKASKQINGKPKADAGSPAESKGTGKTKAGGDTLEAAQQADVGLQNFGNMIPEGLKNRGVRIPAFTEGKPSSLIRADAVTRTDPENLTIEKMVIHLFGQQKEQDVRVDLKTGSYNMPSQVLSSNERSRVSRSDFQIEGDSLVFDTTSSQGKIVGNVEMVIYDVKSLARSMNQEPAGGAEDSAAEAGHGGAKADAAEQKGAPPVNPAASGKPGTSKK